MNLNNYLKLNQLYFPVGIVGYSQQDFNIELAEKYLKKEYEKLYCRYGSFVNVISGYTNLGVPKIAYKLSELYNFKTTGIACKRAMEYECYPVADCQIVGNEWGEESETFLSSIKMLIRIGGGKQSLYETKIAKERNLIVVEYDL